MSSEVTIRKMTIEDVEQVFEIEKLSFTLPWTKDSFYYEMTTNENAYYVVAETEQGVVGYCGMWLVLDEAHVTNIAILPDERGKKLGERLMRAAMDTAKGQGAVLMTLEARVSNEPALNLYRKLGFKNGGIRKRYYTDNFEDAIVMWVNFNE
ncbi:MULTISPECIES: ribosomal protein S18-alanine N-acetyltransferase [unclassified Planococcus (in: firmicutes)]|uniref:ribosomal protein S18-alanine N-acetyltransferase n=1 Tax=unclassified Planococcus (in: firmicutes) TaxID=2662419 RepID=UPI001F488DE0|nr:MULTISPECIES: ribosomal protein S18-alanine N-acetyltransferase [unclassified Planococcus (in: firmicutes)]UJF27437.1 ribosomal protein S18-alanine N-acetyltransferase [Planococcus sp. 107-1]GKW47143.1 ribosomal-protein-alanine acetyltransferase [Planococcus sp. NCCP-2050]